MNTTTGYTPLESLLLFQSLVVYGTSDDDFIQISDLLTNNALVKDGETYDAQRLSSDALRELFLKLLQEELKADDQDGDGPPSKKRKIQSPPLPSFRDAQEYGDKLPLVVDRLYGRYREYMIRSIREDEKRFTTVQKDIGEIERGEWDERILKQDKALANGSTSPATSRTKTNGTSTAGTPKESLQQSSDAPARTPTSHVDSKTDGLAIADVLNSQDGRPSPRPVDNRPQTVSHSNTPQPQRLGSNPPRGPSPLHPPAGHAGPPPLPQNYGWAAPYQPVPTQYSPQYAMQPYPPLPPHRGSVSSPHHLPPPFPVPSSPLSSQHPHHQPHPNQLGPPHQRASPTSPGLPLNSMVDAAGQQGQHAQHFRANSGSPMVPQGQLAYPPQFAQRPPSANGQYSQQWQHGPMQPGQPPYPPQYQTPMYIPPGPQPPHFQTPQSIVQPGSSTYTSPYHPSQGLPPASQNVLRSQPSNPSTPQQKRPLYRTGLGTKWTPTPTSGTPGPHQQVKAPEMEPLSPIQHHVSLPKQSVKKNQKSEPSKTSKPAQRGTKRARAGSTASSVLAGSRRSQSVMSHADELSLDEPLGRRVKEEAATPVGVEDLGDTTADESSAPPRLPPHNLSHRPSSKRKRESIAESRSPALPPTHVLWTRAFPKISASALEAVSGHKNASTFSAPVKERDAPGYSTVILRPQDLKSIRSAITAGNRAASAAAPDDLNPSASSVMLPISEELIPPKGIINYSQLEKELMRMFANAIMFNGDPDRRLSRRWQGMGQERGDIVGYEIDEDGVVKDTKAMFADVEKVIGNLRSAERKSEELLGGEGGGKDDDDDIDELAGDAGEVLASHTGSIAKRRRKA